MPGGRRGALTCMVQEDAARQGRSPSMPISNPPSHLTGFGIDFTERPGQLAACWSTWG